MSTQKDRPKGFARSPCPIANTLDLVGDKWSLLVIRDLLHGKKTYGELADSPEGIPTNILADRLRRLEESGVVSREPYQDHPVRYAYTLTQKGRDFGAILRSLVDWGKKHVPGSRTLSEPGLAAGRRKPAGRSRRAP